MDTLSFFGNPLVILNPAANRGKLDKYPTLVLDRAKHEQAKYVEPTKQGEAKELAAIAAKEGCPVIIVGGDGSVHEAVNGSYFANSFSIGLDADIAVSADRLKHFPFMSGTRLYYTATVKQLLLGYRNCPWLSDQPEG